MRCALKDSFSQLISNVKHENNFEFSCFFFAELRYKYIYLFVIK